MTTSNGTSPGAVPRWVFATAVTGTVTIALGAFWLSFTALVDVARRSGIGDGQAWAWPLIVDGIIVVATISVVALHEHGAAATRYPWLLLIMGAAVSVTANAMHAVLAADVAVPAVLAASVSAVPPLVLLAITHLTVELTRRTRRGAPPAVPRPAAARDVGVRDLRAEAGRLKATSGLSNRQIAARLGVHPSTVGRWLKSPQPSAPTGSTAARNGPRPTNAAMPRVRADGSPNRWEQLDGERASGAGRSEPVTASHAAVAAERARRADRNVNEG